ncbi:MAG: aspartate aminotransferase family protein [Candidatus Puniceispirillaceae bacterium]|jgi:acetylornithine/N-succinyldiaminopimelate aminotransferase|nr:aspartate aminotransferase family protein [Pseudomonadota bacterium]MEE3092208.1 aspartate aminotransferase family protein [Pseudomonadota bacterium]
MNDQQTKDASMAGSQSAVMKTYGRAELAFASGEGCWLVTDDGSRYLDCASGIAVNTLGHSHPGLVAALREQAGKLWHTSNLYRIPGQERVAAKLAALTGLDQVYFCNSGAEANESAVKIARRAMHERGEPDRMTILCATGSFHGRTLGMLAATDKPANRTGFGPMPDGFEHVAFGNLNALRDRMGPHVAAVMIEPVQGEGGARDAQDEYLAGVRAAADEFGALVIADEVQCGIGRTGTLFAYETSGIRPDIIAVAKGLGGGFPVGAVIASEAVGNAMTPGTHGSTFAGNPLAMAVAEVVLDELGAPGFLEDVRRRAGIMRDSLQAVADRYEGAVVELRGRGFLCGVRLADALPAGDAVAAMREENLLTVPAGENTVRFLPPLVISEEEIALAAETFERVLGRMVAAGDG